MLLIYDGFKDVFNNLYMHTVSGGAKGLSVQLDLHIWARVKP